MEKLTLLCFSTFTSSATRVLVMFPCPNPYSNAITASILFSILTLVISLAALSDLMLHWRLGAIPTAKVTKYAYVSHTHPFYVRRVHAHSSIFTLDPIWRWTPKGGSLDFFIYVWPFDFFVLVFSQPRDFLMYKARPKPKGETCQNKCFSHGLYKAYHVQPWTCKADQNQIRR